MRNSVIQTITVFFSHCFQNFFIFGFKKLDYNVSGYYFLLICPVLGSLNAFNLEIYDLLNLGDFQATERLHFHFSLSCIGEGNGNPLQCFCLENPRDGGAWWAAVCGVTQSRTRLK